MVTPWLPEEQIANHYKVCWRPHDFTNHRNVALIFSYCKKNMQSSHIICRSWYNCWFAEVLQLINDLDPLLVWSCCQIYGSVRRLDCKHKPEKDLRFIQWCKIVANKILLCEEFRIIFSCIGLHWEKMLRDDNLFSASKNTGWFLLKVFR